jgi:hypothetical protein
MAERRNPSSGKGGEMPEGNERALEGQREPSKDPLLAFRS